MCHVETVKGGHVDSRLFLFLSTNYGCFADNLDLQMHTLSKVEFSDLQ